MPTWLRIILGVIGLGMILLVAFLYIPRGLVFLGVVFCLVAVLFPEKKPKGS